MARKKSKSTDMKWKYMGKRKGDEYGYFTMLYGHPYVLSIYPSGKVSLRGPGGPDDEMMVYFTSKFSTTQGWFPLVKAKEWASRKLAPIAPTGNDTETDFDPYDYESRTAFIKDMSRKNPKRRTGKEFKMGKWEGLAPSAYAGHEQVAYLQDILEIIGPAALKGLRGKAPPVHRHGEAMGLMESLEAASVLPPRSRGKLGEAILKAAQSRSGKKAIAEAGSELLRYSRKLLPSSLADAAWYGKQSGIQGKRYDIEDHERYQALEYLISLVAASPFFPPASQRKTTQLVEDINLHITVYPEHYTELWELVDYFNRAKVKPLKLPKSHPISKLFHELALTKQAAEFEIPPGVVGEAFRKARSRVDLFQIPQSVKHRRKRKKRKGR